MIVIIFYSIPESYCNFRRNFANDVFAIRPPYKRAYDYNPDKLGPFRILKHNFLNFPIEGFLPQKSDTYLENGIAKMKGNVEYSPMTQDQSYIRDMIGKLDLKNELPIINLKSQARSIDIEKPEYQKEIQQYKFFSSNLCGNEYKPTGAYFTVPEGISCNGQSIPYSRCKAIPIMESGKIKHIKIIDGGKGYTKPIVKILSNDSNMVVVDAKIEVTAVDGEGSIKYIEVIDGGRGYREIPIVDVKDSEDKNACYLCVK